MALEKLQLEHIPSAYQVYVALFRDVANTEFLQAQLLSRNSEFEYAFIDGSSVISRLHLLSAVYSALNTLIDGTLRTPNVHSEIVVSLNINNNVLSPHLLTPSPFSSVGSANQCHRPDRRCLSTVGHNARQDERPGCSQDRSAIINDRPR